MATDGDTLCGLQDDGMSDEPTFVDLFALTKITPDSVVERFGSTINSSFFDASNILGGLKIKKLIDFTTLFGNQNAITITDEGKKLLEEAKSHVDEEFDHLDFSILTKLSNGGKTPTEVSSALNLTPKDLAMRLYKLQAQGFLSAEFRNGSVGLSLTEKGFLQVKNGMPVKPSPMPGSPDIGIQQPSPSQAGMGQEAPAQEQPAEPLEQPEQPKQPEALAGHAGMPKRVKFAVIIVVIVIVLFLVWHFNVLAMFNL